MSGWYQLGNNELIFAYGKTGSTFMSGLHDAKRITRPRCNLGFLTVPHGMIRELKTWPVKSPKDITINLVIRNPLERFVSGLFMIMSDMYNRTFFVKNTHADNHEIYNKLWVDETWWQQTISGFLEFQGVTNLHDRKRYSSMLDRLDEFDMKNSDKNLRGDKFNLFKFIFLDPTHQYHIGNYLDLFLNYEDYKLNIIDLNSLDYFLNSKSVDTSDIFKHTKSEPQQKATSNIDENEMAVRYNAFKTGFYQNDNYALVYEYLLPDIHIYNNFINFGYDNIQHVYNNNEKHLRK